MATIVTKNSSTASAVPTTSDLVQGELAVNVTDKRIFTENASTEIVELGTNPSSITTATATVTGTLTANGTFASSNAVITGGSINSTPIGASTPSTIVGSTITANTGFVGGLTGNVTGNVTGNLTGNVTGDLTGNVTGNVTASSGTTTLNNLVVNGTADFTATKLVNVSTPVAGTDAANKSYVDDTVAAVIDSAPAALDTLNELAAALGDDADLAGTVTTALATKLPLAGGTMTGAIAMGTSKITGLGDPTSAQDAATKIYVDTADALKLNLTGGTMSGAIAMGTNKITGVGDPTLAQDAATKAYTDSILGSATSAADSAAAAASSASDAATSASASASSASDASDSASAAASSASEAASVYDDFDDRYLGNKASDPTVDNDGNALLTGALYFNTTSNDMKVYNGSAWQVTAINPSDPTFTGTVTADGLVIDTDTLYVDSVNNRVGIKTTTPANIAHIKASSNADGLTIQRASTTSGDYGQISFVNSSTDSFAPATWIRSYRGSSVNLDYMTFGSLGLERLRIDSSGNLLVGKTGASSSTQGAELRSDGRLLAVSTSDFAGYFNRKTTDGEIVRFVKDTTTVGSIVTDGGDLLIGTGITGLRFNDGSDEIIPRNTSGAQSAGLTSLGNTSSRFKDAHFSGTVNAANISETVYALSGTALDPANGGIQTKTLSANTTFTDSLASGESLVLQLEAGASYTVTWPTMTWVTSGGNTAPTLTAKDTLVFWKVSSTLYGAYTGSYV